MDAYIPRLFWYMHHMNLIACCDAVSVGIPYEYVRLRPILSASEENFLLVLDDFLIDTIAAFREPFWRKKNMNKNKNCSFLFKKIPFTGPNLI